MRWRIFGFVFLLFLLIAVNPATAQDSEPWLVGINFQQGSVIRHTSKIRHFSGTYPTGLELNFQSQTTGKQAWHQLYRYPRIGASLIYLDYHNLIIGKSLAFSPYLSLPIKRSGKTRVHFRFGSGLAYFSNTFNRRENPGNNIVSTYVNAVIQTRLEYEYAISNQLALLGGIGLNHYSNGGNSKPNLGVNIATASVGINFTNKNYLVTIAHADKPIKRKNYITISSSLGIKQRNDYDTLRYLVKSVAVAALHRINQKSTILMGLEGFYDPSLVPRRGWDPRVKPGTTPDVRRVALNAGHELNFGKVAFGTQLGWYIYRPYKADAPFYQRLETKVQLHKNIYVAAGLKLHDLIKADIIEYRLGLRI